MFYPQAMTEIELIVPAKDILAVTKVLSGRSTFHQADSGYLSSDGKAAKTNNWQEKAVAYSGLERRLQNIVLSLSMEEGSPPKGEFGTIADLDVTRAAVEQIEQEVKKVTEKLSAENKGIEQLEGSLKQLEPMAELDVDISLLRNPRFLFSMLGTMPTPNIERMQTSLSRVPFVLQVLRQDNQNAVVWLAGARNNSDILERAARSAYLNAFSLPESYQGAPAAIIKTIQADVAEARKRVEGLKAEIERLRKTYQSQVQAVLWNVRASRMLTDAIVRYGQLRYTYVTVGWVPTNKLEDLKQRLANASKETLLETFPTKRDGDNEQVPVALDHARPLWPFQSLVTTYARPRYGEIDPTWLIAVTFPILYGAMFGDLGQGLVLAVLGWLIMTKRIMKSMTSLGGLILACGLSAAVFGVLYGSVFGFENIIHAVWMEPIKNIMTILVIAIGVGLVLLSIGFLIGIYNGVVMKEWGRVFFGNTGVTGLMLYWSMLGIAGGAFLPDLHLPTGLFVVTAVIGGIGVMFAEVFRHLLEGHRPLIEGGIATYAIQAFFELFEAVITYVSNSLSYIRVGAFAVAHGGLSQAIFSMAGPEGTVGFFITIIIGNLIIIGLEGLIVGIQTMRLSYYEFFSKFFTGGGARFEPLTLYPGKDE